MRTALDFKTATYTTILFLAGTVAAQERVPARDSLVRRLEEVRVEALSAKKRLEESPFSVQVLDLKNEHSKSADAPHLLNRALGVKIRTDGGLGSAVQAVLGGLQGKAVRVFRDGMPVELFGHGFGLGILPANMLDRIEVYKGVMPVYLASDALGGGINLVTRHPAKTLAEAAYETGSFGTHRATVHLFFARPKKPGLYGGANASYNRSANAYAVDAPFYDTVTAQRDYRTAKRFHDAARSFYGELYAGMRHRPWADDLRMTVVRSGFFREIQHDAEMVRVYGEAFSEEDGRSALLNYRKAFFDGRLKTRMTGVYSRFDTRFVDTASRRYGWDGSVRSHSMPSGEINRGNDQRLAFDLYSARLNAEQALGERHFLEIGIAHHQQRRTGSDPLGAVSVVEQVDVMTVPAVYRRNSLALAVRSPWRRGMVESIIGLKRHGYRTEGFTTDNYNFAWRAAKTDGQWGCLAGIKWSDGGHLLKLSYERAARLPDEQEIFGDGVMVRENLDLEPEKSHNANLNARRSFAWGGQRMDIAANLFYRHVRDIIVLQMDIPFNRHINYEESRIKGLEIEARYSPAGFLSGGFNLTYQDIRRVNIREAMFRNLEGSRIPNIPYFFGNAFLSLEKNGLFRDGDRARAEWNAHYAHRFFLKAVPRDQEPSLFGSVDAFQTSLVIPRDGRTGQFAGDMVLSYRFPGGNVALSGECRNIGNVKLYDNFNVQRPGRSFHMKVSF